MILERVIERSIVPEADETIRYLHVLTTCMWDRRHFGWILSGKPEVDKAFGLLHLSEQHQILLYTIIQASSNDVNHKRVLISLHSSHSVLQSLRFHSSLHQSRASFRLELQTLSSACAFLCITTYLTPASESCAITILVVSRLSHPHL